MLRKFSHRSARRAAFRNPHSQRGFTLVELMVVVLIVTILATIVLGAMFQATETAKAARTRAQIQKIHSLLAPMWEAYRTRRVPIAIPPNTHPMDAARMRLDALRELMRMELPDRKSDVIDNPVTIGVRPALSEAYKRRALGSWSETNQGAECLYLILSRIQDGETNGLDFFSDTEIGDTDIDPSTGLPAPDGMPEILDGWGTPIRLLRWAPGFVDGLPGVVSTLQNGNDPDAFDPYGVRGTPTGMPKSYFLFPLVMSAGPDKQWDIAFDGMTAIQYSTTSPKNDPFGLPVSLGQPDDNNGNNGGTPAEHVDNIHNHLLITGVR